MILKVIFIALILIFIDVYAYRGMRTLFSHRQLNRFRKFSLNAYWLVDVALLVFGLFWIGLVRSSSVEDYVKFRRFYVLFGVFLLIVIPKISFFIFVLLNDFRTLGKHWISRIRPTDAKLLLPLRKTRPGLLLLILGLFFSIYMFSVTLYGFSIGRKNFRIEEVELWFENLPEGFDGFRIAHFSDVHLGSFSREDKVVDGLEVINGLKPDLILFTGDLVNNDAREAELFISVFQRLQATEGMFSVLGNHDIGDYRTWGTIKKKDPDVDRLVEIQTMMGFRVLLNEHAFIRRDGDSIMIAGVENWGMPPFGQHGDLEKTLGDNAEFPFKILLSHDPSHWRKEIIPNSNVDLTLSGHTHGMQFGIRNQFINWSPAQYRYNEWAGLYSEGDQKLYVNRGFGFLSIPGRVGMPPEITLITLRKESLTKL